MFKESETVLIPRAKELDYGSMDVSRVQTSAVVNFSFQPP